MKFDKSFVIEGAAVPMARPRFTRNNGVSRAYEPKECIDFKVKAKMVFLEKMRGETILSDPCLVETVYYFKPPETWSVLRKVASLFTPSMNRKDIDNLDKTILDAMTGSVFIDDHLATGKASFKLYAPKDMVQIRVRSWDSFKDDPRLFVPEFSP